MRYYIHLNQTVNGPFTLHQLRSMWNQGQITAAVPFNMEGTEAWHPLSDLQGELETNQQPAPLIAQPAHNTQICRIAKKDGSWADLFALIVVALIVAVPVCLFMAWKDYNYLFPKFMQIDMPLLFIAFMVLGIALYFLPLIIAGNRKTSNFGSIAMLNLFLGWTGLGWFAALLWSCTDRPKGK